VNPFIEECRREWRRLRVPDAVANEMATDLASDLGEAEAEGISAEEVLGSGAFDPRSFAASWAAERGVIPSSPVRANPLRRPVNLIVIATGSVLGAVGAALILFASRTGSSISVAPQGRPFAPPMPRGQVVHRLTAVDVVDALAGILLVLAILGMALSAYVWMSRRRSRPPGALA
jgi:hypothetical protein